MGPWRVTPHNGSSGCVALRVGEVLEPRRLTFSVIGITAVILLSSSFVTYANGMTDFSLSPYQRDVRAYGPNYHYSRLSRALEKMHFAPLFNFRLRNTPSRKKLEMEKKALSFVSRFYALQHRQPSRSWYSRSPTPLNLRQASDGASVGRISSRPILRLRWGK